MGVKISELNEASSVQNSDVLPIVQNGETKKIPVGTLGSQKVNKSGDTLTGELQFNNKNDYGAIRKARTINGTDYGVSIGVGGNTSARMELYQGNTTLGSVEARSDGVYNGVSTMKLAESAHLTWGTSMSFKLEGSHHALAMIGKNDCLMLWAAGNPVELNITRIIGTTAQATYNSSTQMVTITYGGGSFSGNVLII